MQFLGFEPLRKKCVFSLFCFFLFVHHWDGRFNIRRYKKKLRFPYIIIVSKVFGCLHWKTVSGDLWLSLLQLVSKKVSKGCSGFIVCSCLHLYSYLGYFAAYRDSLRKFTYIFLLIRLMFTADLILVLNRQLKSLW